MQCEICNRDIDPERLECVPDTSLCIEHAQKIAKYGGEFTLTAIQGNIGKVGSLKKNYGDVDVHKKRNYDALDELRKEYHGKSD